jgi:two-component system chemotaxis sensor kinase CheA
MLNIKEHRFAIPMANVEQILSVPVNKILSDEDTQTKSVIVDETPVPIVDLRSYLKFNSHDARPEQDKSSIKSNTLENVILWRKGSRNLGFLVNELLGERDVVIKPINDFLSQVGTFSGATVLEGGQVVLIINPMNFLETQIHA